MLAKGTEDQPCEVCKTKIGSARYVVVQADGTLKVVHRDCHDTWVRDSK